MYTHTYIYDTHVSSQRKKGAIQEPPTPEPLGRPPPGRLQPLAVLCPRVPPRRAALIPHESSVSKYCKQPKQEELNLETQLSPHIQEGKRKITHQALHFSQSPKVPVQVFRVWMI